MTTSAYDKIYVLGSSMLCISRLNFYLLILQHAVRLRNARAVKTSYAREIAVEHKTRY